MFDLILCSAGPKRPRNHIFSSLRQTPLSTYVSAHWLAMEEADLFLSVSANRPTLSYLGAIRLHPVRPAQSQVWPVNLYERRNRDPALRARRKRKQYTRKFDEWWKKAQLMFV